MTQFENNILLEQRKTLTRALTNLTQSQASILHNFDIFYTSILLQNNIKVFGHFYQTFLGENHVIILLAIYELIDGEYVRLSQSERGFALEYL